MPRIATLLLLLALVAPASADDEKPVDKKQAVQAWMRELWNELAGGEPQKFKDAFALETFVEYAAADLPIAALYKNNLEKGLRKGLRSKVAPMIDQLAKDWAKAWLDVCEPTKDDQGRWMVEVATFDYRTEQINFSTWRIVETKDGFRWFDFQEMVNGTWMKTRMTGVTVMLLTLKIKPEEVHLCRQLGEAGGAANWDLVRRTYHRMSAALQKHRAILPTARVAALQLEDKKWLVALRKRWIDALGTDSSLLFGDIDHYAVLGQKRASLAAARALRDKKGGHPLLRYKVAVLAHGLGDYDDARDSAYAAIAGAPDFPPARVIEIAALAGKKDHAAAVKAAVFLRKKWPVFGRKNVNWLDQKLFHALPTSPEFLKAFGYALKPPGPKKEQEKK